MEGIFAALDSLPDDCVEYSVFLADDASAAVLDLDRKCARLEQIRDDALDLARPWTKDYIWQRQPFTLRLLELSDEPCLRGVTEFGDCIDDEWFIVFILRELSRRHPDLYIRIADNDGEFLLIEAADALPRWINPDNADNRVWIINGELNIIPAISDDDDDSISSLNLTDALHFLNTSKSTLFHPKALQTAAFSRLSDYPSAAKSHIHRAKATVPRRVAQILHLNKSYIAPACEAFMLRDPISMRACSSMKNFPPSDSVTVTVQFTRLLYAQMKAQRIVPPAPFKLPEPSNPTYDAAELGMKLACGFELLCAGSGKSTKNKQRRSDLASDPRFNTYLSQLKREGFFDSAKPNSPKYDVLMREAQKTYLTICGDEYVPLEIGKEIISMVESMPPATDEDIRQWDHGQIEDSDSWLDVDFDDFVKTMDSLNGSAALENNDTAEREEFEQLQGKAKDLFQKLNTFVGDKESGLDGVTFDEYVNYFDISFLYFLLTSSQ
ncbi:SGT1 protein-domain-containing protein [Myxozyma melibiosi]|uniref:SGT1 protein-domain-containing protein n=1 Tax=Myxozyma melibiosi TaxID=54550 RepID=A0ABR1FA10_9ASCO